MKRFFVFCFLLAGNSFSQQYVIVSGCEYNASPGSVGNGNYYLEGTKLNSKNWYNKDNTYVLKYSAANSEWELAPYADRNSDALTYNSCYYFIASSAETPPGSGWSWNGGSLPPANNFTVSNLFPVELSSFTTSIKDCKVTLNWRTQTEVNNYGFEVERTQSRNINWERIGFVQGYGNSNSPKEYSLIDRPAGACEFKYRLKQIDFDGKYEYSPEIEVNLEVPANFSVKQNYPNPFNPTTKIEFSIPSDNNVEIKVFNVLGMEVATLLNEYKQASTHNIEFNAGNLSSGIYFYKIVSGNYFEIKKMILLR